MKSQMKVHALAGLLASLGALTAACAGSPTSPESNLASLSVSLDTSCSQLPGWHLPVYVDLESVGSVSLERPLTVGVSVGQHRLSFSPTAPSPLPLDVPPSGYNFTVKCE